MDKETGGQMDGQTNGPTELLRVACTRLISEEKDEDTQEIPVAQRYLMVNGSLALLYLAF